MSKNQILAQKPLARLYNSITISNLWISILSLASKQPIYAYTLAQSIEKEFGFKPSRLLIYLVLYKLEGEKYLTSKEHDKRRYYSLTSKGRTILQDAKSILISRAQEL